MRMSESSSGPRWRLSVWFDRSGDAQTFDFDVEPDGSIGQAAASYFGEREGRTVRVYIAIDGVSAWSLEEISR